MASQRWWQPSPRRRYVALGLLVGVPLTILTALAARVMDLEWRRIEAEELSRHQKSIQLLHDGETILRERLASIFDRVWSSQDQGLSAIAVQDPARRAAFSRFMRDMQPFLRYTRRVLVTDAKAELVFPAMERVPRGDLNALVKEFEVRINPTGNFQEDAEEFERMIQLRWCVSEADYARVTNLVRRALLKQIRNVPEAWGRRLNALLKQEEDWLRQAQADWRWMAATRSRWKRVLAKQEGLEVVRLTAKEGGRLLAVAPIRQRGAVTGAWIAELDEARLIQDVRTQFQEQCQLLNLEARIVDGQGRVVVATTEAWPVKGDWGHHVEAMELTETRTGFLGSRLEVASREVEGDSADRDAAVNRLWMIGSLLAGALGVMGLAMWWTFKLVGAELEVARLSSNFVSNVSHELKTPLSVLLLAAEKLSLGRIRSPEQAQEYYQLMLAEGQRLKRLIENVLDFSKISAGQKTYQLSPDNLSEVVGRVMTTLGARLEHEGFAVTVVAPEGLPPVRLDRDAVTQAVMNLIDNAMKYSQERKELRVAVVARPGEVAVEVQDRGQGIRSEDQRKIFEKFYQVGDALKSEMKGVGLGLAIVRYIMEAHGGRVEVESRSGEGSTFRLVFPAGKEAATGVQRNAEGGPLNA